MAKRVISGEQREKARLRSNAWAEAHRDLANARAKAWYDANKRKPRVIKYATAEERIVAARERAARWRKENAERASERDKAAYLANREARLQAVKAYRDANPDKMRANGARKKAEKAKRTPPWLTEEHHAQMRAFYDLALRKTRETGEEWHVDHIVPLRGRIVSGLHVPWNLQVIPARENMTKKNKFVGFEENF